MCFFCLFVCLKRSGTRGLTTVFINFGQRVSIFICKMEEAELELYFLTLKFYFSWLEFNIKGSDFIDLELLSS